MRPPISSIKIQTGNLIGGINCREWKKSTVVEKPWSVNNEKKKNPLTYQSDSLIRNKKKIKP